MIEVSKAELYSVMSCDEFNRILNSDKVLDALEMELDDRGNELLQFAQITGNEVYISGVKIYPLTAALWTMLFIMGNAYACRSEVKEADIEQMLYMLHIGAVTRCGTPDEISSKAKYFFKNKKLKHEEVGADLYELIYSAFKPLELLPQSSSGGGNPKYDCDWMVRIASVAAQTANCTFTHAAQVMPLALACSLYVQHYRTETGEKCERRTSDEISKQMFERTIELGKEFYCAKKGIEAGSVKWL